MEAQARTLEYRKFEFSDLRGGWIYLKSFQTVKSFDSDKAIGDE